MAELSQPGTPTIRLAAYAADPDTREGRRLRRRITISLSAFCFFYGIAFAFLAPYLLLYFALPLVIVSLLIIWALPDIANPPVRWLSPLLFAFLIGLIAWPNYLALALPGLPWITIQRLTGFPLSILLLICLSASKSFRSTLAPILRDSSLLVKFLGAFVAVQVVTIAFSHHVSVSIDQVFVAQISWTAVFFVSAYVFVQPGRVTLMAATLWGLAILVCIIGFGEWLQSRVLWSGHIPSFLKIEDPAVMRILAGSRRSADGVYRVVSTFSTALGLGEYLALVMPFVLQFGVGRYPLWVKVLAAVSAPFIMFIVLVTGSRLGFIGCLISFTLYLGVWAVLRWRRLKGGLIAPAVLFSYPIFFALAVASTFVSHQIRAKVWGNGPQAASDEGRKIQWAMGIPKILTHPQGHGAGTSGDILGYITESGVNTVDSFYLTIALDYGFLGIFTYYGFILIAMYIAGREAMIPHGKHRDYAFLAPIAIAIVNFIVIKSVFSQTENHPVIYMIVGALVALVHRLRNDDRGGESRAVTISRPRRASTR